MWVTGKSEGLNVARVSKVIRIESKVTGMGGGDAEYYALGRLKVEFPRFSTGVNTGPAIEVAAVDSVVCR